MDNANRHHAATAIDGFDDRRRYCRLLGHEVPFSYCRAPASEVFCRHVVDCWSERFDVRRFLNEHFDAQMIEKALGPVQPKMSRLVSLIHEAKTRNDQ